MKNIYLLERWWRRESASHITLYNQPQWFELNATGKMLKCIFMLLKARMNTSCCVYGQIVILKNSIVRKQHLDHRMQLVTYVHVVTGSNSAIQSNYRTSIIPKYFCPNHHRSTSMFHIWNQAFRMVGFLGHSPNINPPWTRWRMTHLTILHI